MIYGTLSGIEKDIVKKSFIEAPQSYPQISTVMLMCIVISVVHALQYSYAELLGLATSATQEASIGVQLILSLLEMKASYFALRNLTLLEHGSNGLYFSEMT